MKQKRKSKFFTFIFSFMPGAAEMYMGFMKNGFSLMLLFLLSFVLFVAGSGFDFLIPFCAVLWFYGFFHARNLAGMDDQDFLAMKDIYVWEEFSDIKFNKLAEKSSKKWIAIALIVVGAAMLWDYFSGILYSLIPGDYWQDFYPVVNGIPTVAVAILMVIIGVKLIKGKKVELDALSETEAQPIADIAQIEDKSLDSKEA